MGDGAAAAGAAMAAPHFAQRHYYVQTRDWGKFSYKADRSALDFDSPQVAPVRSVDTLTTQNTVYMGLGH